MLDVPEVSEAEVRRFRLDSRGNARRAIEATWPIEKQASGEDGHYLIFEAWHDAHHKRLVARVDTHELTDGGTCVRRVFDYGRSSVVVATRPVARYSAKALGVFFDSLVSSDELPLAMRLVLERRADRSAAAS